MAKESPFFLNPDGSRHEIQQPKPELTIFQETTALLQRARELEKRMEIGKREGVWQPQPDYPDLPIVVLMMTDPHYGSLKTNYTKLVNHLDIVENTPNFFLVTNGDDIDNFNVTTKAATGVYENPISPQRQTQSWMEKVKELDEKKKLGAMSFGNHNNMMFNVGYDWLENFARDVQAPIFTAGGFLHLLEGDQHYGVAMTHRYWGSSKLNPTNACKRYLDFEFPQADVVFLGHTHQSEILTFEKGGKERIGLIGGTYKEDDTFARQHGIGGRAGNPGLSIMFFPHEHRMIGFKHIEDAQMLMTGMIDGYAKKGVALLGLASAAGRSSQQR